MLKPFFQLVSIDGSRYMEVFVRGVVERRLSRLMKIPATDEDNDETWNVKTAGWMALGIS